MTVFANVSNLDLVDVLQNVVDKKHHCFRPNRARIRFRIDSGRVERKEEKNFKKERNILKKYEKYINIEKIMKNIEKI